MSKTAHILAVDAQYLSWAGEGVDLMSGYSIIESLQGALFIGPRPLLEQDERFRQIIPYIVLKQGDRFLGYVRGTEGGEARLHGKISIGAGGHIDLPDIVHGTDENYEPNGNIDLEETLHQASVRELDEELRFMGGDDESSWPEDPPEIRWVGILRDDGDAVGRVHIGVIGIGEIDPGMIVKAGEDCMSDLEFFTAEQLEANKERLEGWSALLLPHLSKIST